MPCLRSHPRYGAALLAMFPVLVLSCTSSCSGSSSSATPLDSVPEKLAAATCDVFADCLGPALPIFLHGQDCTLRTTDELRDGEFSLLQSAIDAGTIHYDGTKVGDCVDAIHAGGCGALVKRLSSLCKGVLTGTIAAGKDCSFDAECTTGLFCKTDGACPGACTPLLSAGQSCRADDDCDDGLTCSSDTSKCVAPAAEGDSCDGPSDPPCAPGTFCQGATDTGSGTCSNAAHVFSVTDGETCDLQGGTLCKEGLGCALVGVTAGKATFECEKPASGTACHVAYPEACADGSYCELSGSDPDGTCKPLPGDGASCAKHVPADLTSTDALCAPGTVCDNGTCRKIAHLGAGCSADDQCFSKVCKNGGCAPAECEP